jgi:hypothetical protein
MVDQLREFDWLPFHKSLITHRVPPVLRTRFLDKQAQILITLNKPSEFERIMKSTQSGTTSTAASSQAKSETAFKHLLAWLGVWWPIPGLGTVFAAAGVFKYLLPKTNLYPVMVDLIKAISVLMVAVYVVYTRILSIETKKMAEASMGLYTAERGTVLAELSEIVCDYRLLPAKAQEAARTVHLEDKKMSKEEFDSLLIDHNLPTVNLRIQNMSGRRIEIRRIDYKVRHTGSDKNHSVICDVSNAGTLNPWGDKDVPLMVAPEGEIEIFVCDTGTLLGF